ncbi:riboflavin kinase [Ureaplasma canigenitalium]|uniref:riboflavin kinase n=1 Tax=Ureaplasma canigenitalium TaxID=42092 RepID=UPI0004E0D9A5|nr:riboflavin kinase [Ureaplasma canigenitalium]
MTCQIVYLNKSSDFKKIKDTFHLIMGYFDGLHCGHLSLFPSNNEISILTFINVPKKSYQIYNLEERVRQLKKIPGVVQILVWDISKLNWDGITFIRNFLQKTNFKNIIVGENFTFGNDQRDSVFLMQHCENLTIKKINQQISSTTIKGYLRNGELEKANQHLQYHYYVVGQVVYGKQIGITINFPTANIILNENGTLVKDGVYLGSVLIKNKTYKTMIYVGTKNGFKQLEAYLLDFSNDLYHQVIQVNFDKRIADIIKIKDLNHLKELLCGYKKALIEHQISQKTIH